MLELTDELSKAFKVVELLQEWIDEQRELDSAEIVSGLTYTDRTLSVFIGDYTVWDDQACGIDELTFDACREVFLEWVQSVAKLLPREPG